MRAVRLQHPGGLDALRLEEVPAQHLGPESVRVRLHASSLNYHDYLVATGAIPVADGRVPMSDGAGEVIEVGADVDDLMPGDRVVGTFYPRWGSGVPEAGALSELPGDRTDGYARDEVVAAARSFTRAPAGFSHVEAATLPCAALTAWRALFVETTVLPGETVLVQGTGGVSVFALQLAKAAGARVVATSSSDAKLGRLRDLGADHVVNYREEVRWGSAVRRATGGRGVDHVVEIGGSFTQSAAACRPGGHIALVSMLDGMSTPFPFMSMIGKNLRISGLSVGSREHHEAMTRAIDAIGLRPVIDRTYALEEIADAFRYQASGEHVGKICLTW